MGDVVIGIHRAFAHAQLIAQLLHRALEKLHREFTFLGRNAMFVDGGGHLVGELLLVPTVGAEQTIAMPEVMRHLVRHHERDEYPQKSHQLVVGLGAEHLPEHQQLQLAGGRL